MRKVLVNVAFSALAGVAVTACGTAVGTTADSGTAVHVNMANDRFEINTPDQMCGTLLVASGTVSSYGVAHWNTGNGVRPDKLDETGLVQGGYAIVTPIRLGQMAAEHDRRTTPTREFDVVGGSVGQDSWRDSSFPRPAPGGRFVMVFVPTQVPGGTFTQESLTLYEAFPIDSTDVVTLRPQTIEQGQVSQTAVKISLVELNADLARCK